MTDRDKLRRMNACMSALDWIGDRTIEQAWSECGRGGWMCWLLERIATGDPRLRLAAADIAERVWDLIPDEPTRLVAAWAIGAARRGDADEMRAAYAAAAGYTDAAAAAAAYDAAAAAYDAANAAATNATNADAYADAYAAESAAQADILRGYFSASEISDLFNRS